MIKYFIKNVTNFFKELFLKIKFIPKSLKNKRSNYGKKYIENYNYYDEHSFDEFVKLFEKYYSDYNYHDFVQVKIEQNLIVIIEHKKVFEERNLKFFKIIVYYSLVLFVEKYMYILKDDKCINIIISCTLKIDEGSYIESNIYAGKHTYPLHKSDIIKIMEIFEISLNGLYDKYTISYLDIIRLQFI